MLQSFCKLKTVVHGILSEAWKKASMKAMIYKNNCTLLKEYLEQLTVDGLEILPEIIRLLVNQAMQIERENYLQAEP